MEDRFRRVGQSGTHTTNYFGNSNKDDYESGDFDAKLVPVGKGVGRVVLEPNLDNTVYHSHAGDPNYVRREEQRAERRFRQQYHAEQKRKTTPISLQAALAEARKLKQKYKERYEKLPSHEENIENSRHALRCGDLAHGLKGFAARVTNVPPEALVKVVTELTSEMRKAYGIKGHAVSDGDRMISMQAHNKVMHDICQRAVKLLEEVKELTGNGGNGSMSHE